MDKLLEFLEEQIPETKSNIDTIKRKKESLPSTKQKFLNEIATILLELDNKINQKLKDFESFRKNLNQLQVGTILAFLAENVQDCKKEIKEIVDVYEKKITQLPKTLKEFDT